MYLITDPPLSLHIHSKLLQQEQMQEAHMVRKVERLFCNMITLEYNECFAFIEQKANLVWRWGEGG